MAARWALAIGCALVLGELGAVEGAGLRGYGRLAPPELVTARKKTPQPEPYDLDDTSWFTESEDERDMRVEAPSHWGRLRLGTSFPESPPGDFPDAPEMHHWPSNVAATGQMTGTRKATASTKRGSQHSTEQMRSLMPSPESPPQDIKLNSPLFDDQEMSWGTGLEQSNLEGNLQMFAPNFEEDVVGEVITISYPDGSGVFDVRILGYDARSHFHIVSSRGLSLWGGEEFTDEIDLNAYFRAGHVRFRRLSEIYGDGVIQRRSQRPDIQKKIRKPTGQTKKQSAKARSRISTGKMSGKKTSLLKRINRLAKNLDRAERIEPMGVGFNLNGQGSPQSQGQGSPQPLPSFNNPS